MFERFCIFANIFRMSKYAATVEIQLLLICNLFWIPVVCDTSGCFDRISVCVGWPINEEVQDNFLETYLFDKAKPFLCIFIGKCKKSMPDYDMNRHRCALRSCAWRILPDKREAFAVIIAGERTDFLRSYKYRMPVWFLKSNKK